MPFHHEEAHCCGSVLTLIKEPLIAHDIGQTRLEEAREVGAETVLAFCPCCEFQFRVTKEKKDTPVEVRDLPPSPARRSARNSLTRAQRSAGSGRSSRE